MIWSQNGVLKTYFDWIKIQFGPTVPTLQSGTANPDLMVRLGTYLCEEPIIWQP